MTISSNLYSCRGYLWTHGFALLWVMAFIIGSSRFVLVASASIWYFDREARKTENPIGKSLKWLFKFHAGSVAFGSLILAIVWALQIIAEYVSVFDFD